MVCETPQVLKPLFVEFHILWDLFYFSPQDIGQQHLSELVLTIKITQSRKHHDLRFSKSRLTLDQTLSQDSPKGCRSSCVYVA